MIKKENFKSGGVFYYLYERNFNNPNYLILCIRKVKLTTRGVVDKNTFFGKTIDEIEIRRSKDTIIEMGEYSLYSLYYTFNDILKKIKLHVLIKAIFYEAD
jgi:hypothetical protein